MKTTRANAKRGFTLIELLTVISIIAILAGMLLPAVSTAIGRAKKVKCQKDIADFVGAINAYNADYSRMPTTPQTRDTHAGYIATSPDLVFGNVGVDAAPGSKPPMPQYPNPTIIPFNPNNAEIVAILMDQTNITTSYLPGIRVNDQFAQNPKKQVYLNAKQVNGPIADGVDLSINSIVNNKGGVYRDPWGHPYMVTLDMDYDNRCRSPFDDVLPNGTRQPRYISQTALVWSFGPDGQYDTTKAGNLGVNKDNIYSWQ